MDVMLQKCLTDYAVISNTFGNYISWLLQAFYKQYKGSNLTYYMELYCMENCMARLKKLTNKQ